MRARVERKNSRKGGRACQLFLQRQVPSKPACRQAQQPPLPEAARVKAAQPQAQLSEQRVSKRNLRRKETLLLQKETEGRGDMLRDRKGVAG